MLPGEIKAFFIDGCVIFRGDIFGAMKGEKIIYIFRAEPGASNGIIESGIGKWMLITEKALREKVSGMKDDLKFIEGILASGVFKD